MTTIKAGDEVRVLGTSHRSRTNEPGVVEKVGRTLVHIRFSGHVEKFRMDTRIVNSDFGGLCFETPADADRKMRRQAALATLSEHHLEIRIGREHRYPLEHLEALAEVARTFTDTEA